MVRVLLIFGLFSVTGALYISSFPGSFHYDDLALLLENPVVTGDGFPFQLFFSHHWGRPLTLLSYHWTYQLFGDDPFPFHLLSFSLHLLVVLMIYVAVKKCFGREYLAFATALIFAVHPIQSQAVNYIWSQSILLMSVFGLLCLLLCQRYPVLGLVLFQFAIWSRAEALVLVVPLILLVPDRRKWILSTAGVNAALLAGYVYLRPPGDFLWTHSDPVSFWLAAPLAFWKYIELMFWPVHLTIDHPHFKGALLPTALSILALTIILWSLVLWRRRYQELVLGVSWILLFLGPSLLIPNGDLLNESRSYLAFAGFALGMAFGIEKISKTAGTPLVAAGALLLPVCLLWGPITISRGALWQDEAGLWAEAVRYSPNELRARYNLGVALVKAGEQELADSVFRKALELDPADDMSHAALGYCAEFRGARLEALKSYGTALSLNPDNEYARRRMDMIQEGKMDR